MDILHAIILGIVEGITEFLPVSSTGHMVLASTLLNIPQTDFVKSFEIFIQLGAILAIVVLYWQKYIQNIKVWKNVLIAFIPTGLIGLVLYKFVKDVLLGNPAITVAALLIGGLALIGLEKIYQEKESHVSKIEDLTYQQSFLIGLIQSLSIIPGVSRSAATILGGMFLGAKRATAVEFSFLLAVPTMLAASGLDLVKDKTHHTGSEWMILILGFVVAFVTALIVVKWFIKFIQKNNFIPFGIYRIIIALLFWLVILR